MDDFEQGQDGIGSRLPGLAEDYHHCASQEAGRDFEPEYRLLISSSCYGFPKKTERFALKDEFDYTGLDGTRGRIVMPGTEFVGTNVSNTAKMTALTGMAYFNLLRQSR